MRRLMHSAGTAALLFLGAAACSSGRGAEPSENRHPATTPERMGAEMKADGAAAPPEVDESLLSQNGCKPAAYEDRSGEDDDRAIAVAKDGLVYTPKCLTIAVGQSVVWQGTLSAHPLAPGNPDDPEAGSPASPIAATAEGTSVEFEFQTAGSFPYYCAIHSFGAGKGMAGVVHVK